MVKISNLPMINRLSNYLRNLDDVLLVIDVPRSPHIKISLTELKFMSLVSLEEEEVLKRHTAKPMDITVNYEDFVEFMKEQREKVVAQLNSLGVEV